MGDHRASPAPGPLGAGAGWKSHTLQENIKATHLRPSVLASAEHTLAALARVYPQSTCGLRTCWGLACSQGNSPAMEVVGRTEQGKVRTAWGLLVSAVAEDTTVSRHQNLRKTRFLLHLCWPCSHKLSLGHSNPEPCGAEPLRTSLPAFLRCGSPSMVTHGTVWPAGLP